MPAPAPLQKKLVDAFCATFGERHRRTLTPQTSMDDVPEWTSTTFLDLVFAVEDAYGVSFTETETAQMFQLGHIQRLVEHARLDLPHDDVAHACSQIHGLRALQPRPFSLVLLSGSSTREGLQTGAECRDLLRALTGDPGAAWLNLSVSGLVAAETLQLLELIGPLESGVYAVGYSPVIFAGCGEAEFRRSALHERFPFAAPRMDRVLARHGYAVTRPEDLRPSIELELWMRRYLKDRRPEDLHYDPYIYPTLAPWAAPKFRDEESILRFYNRSILNFEQSMRVNAELLEEIADLAAARSVPLVLVELTLHSEMVDYLERLGRVASRSAEFRADFCRRRGIPWVPAAAAAQVTDADFRDPAHLFRGRDRYTRAVIDGVLKAIR